MPEILRSNVTAVVLTLKRLGVQNLAKFDFLSPPPAQALVRALETLFFLGALDGEGAITELGKMLLPRGSYACPKSSRLWSCLPCPACSAGLWGGTDGHSSSPLIGVQSSPTL